MTVTEIRIGRKTIKIIKDWMDGLYSVIIGKETFWVTDNIDSAIEYYNNAIKTIGA